MSSSPEIRIGFRVGEAIFPSADIAQFTMTYGLFISFHFGYNGQFFFFSGQAPFVLHGGPVFLKIVGATFLTSRSILFASVLISH